MTLEADLKSPVGRRRFIRLFLGAGAALPLAAACQSAPPAAPAQPAAAPTSAPAAKPAEAPKPAASAEAAKPAGPPQPAAAAPAASPAVAKPSGPITTVKVTSSNNMTSVPFFVAVEKGFWLKRGLDVKLTTFGTGAEIVKSIQAKEADYITNAFANFLPAVDQGLPFTVLGMSFGDATQKYRDTAFAIVATKDSGIKKIEDLAGKRVGVLASGTPDEYLRAALSRAKISPDSVQIMNVAPERTVAAFQTNQIDASSSLEPYGTLVMDKVPGTYLVQRGGGYISYGAFFITRPDVVVSQPDVVQRMVEGWLETCWWTRQNLDQAAEITTRWAPGLELDTAKKSIRFVPFDPRVSSLVLDMVAEQKKLLLENKKIKGDIDIEKIMSLSFLKKSLAEHPEWVADLPPAP
ncbi:MAG: ABC transporter substrate-binding protein [Chloroflexi bacterium]|nr:ABC transporter substrate-binding protein [Chloroflexota bacterium]